MWDDIALIFSHLGDPVTLALMAAAATVLLWRRRNSVIEVAVPIAALIVAGAIEFITKRIIGRPRPPAVYHLLQETDPSFPSGHATGSAAFFVALALVVSPSLRHALSRLALVLASGALAALIGVSRVVLGVHWFTDIAAGWLLGVAVAAGAVLVCRQYLLRVESGCRRMASSAADEGSPGVVYQQVLDDVPIEASTTSPTESSGDILLHKMSPERNR